MAITRVGTVMPSALPGVLFIADFQSTPTMLSSVNAKSFPMRMADCARNSRTVVFCDITPSVPRAPSGRAPDGGLTERAISLAVVPSAFKTGCAARVLDTMRTSG